MTLKQNMGQNRSSTFAIASLLFVASTATILSKFQMCLSLLLLRVGYTHPSILGSSLDSQDPFLIHLCGVGQDLPQMAAGIL
jgi:TPP-dependent 2-oxoacid decarboxylase